jgi:hypothetical protein
MKKNLFVIALLSIITLASCTKTETVEVAVDASQPVGTFTKARMGTLVPQNGTPTAGMVQIGTDSKGTSFLKMGTDFKTELGTGTVTVFLSTSGTYKADPMKGNPDLKLVGVVSKNGEQFVKLNTAVPSNFTHIILWCATAGIPFGNAPVN